MDRDQLKKNLLTALFSALMAAGAFLRIPVGPVPVTLTSFFLLLAGVLLGPGRAAAAAFIYLAAGTLGLPAFAGGAGPGVFAGPTGGFLIAYIPAALLCGLISPGRTATDKAGRTMIKDGAAVAAGSIVLYAVGVPWLKWRLGLEWGPAAAAGMIPFLPGDAVKAAAVVIIRQVLIKSTADLLPDRRS